MSENNLPDKCDYCGLKQTFSPNTDNLFQNLRLLFKKGIIKNEFSRKIYMSDGVDFCLISHPSWLNKEQSCESWQLDVRLPKGDSLSINFAAKLRDMTKTIECLTYVIMFLALLQIIITVLS